MMCNIGLGVMTHCTQTLLRGVLQLCLIQKEHEVFHI